MKQVSFNWLQLLKNALEDKVYRHQGNTDTHVFSVKKDIVLGYVNNIIKKKFSGIATRLIDSLQDRNGLSKDESNLHRYLGVGIRKHKDGTVDLSQPHLIDRSYRGGPRHKY